MSLKLALSRNAYVEVTVDVYITTYALSRHGEIVIKNPVDEPIEFVWNIPPDTSMRVE